MTRQILKISNELELGLSGTNAKEVLGRVRSLDLCREVNPRDCVELRVSMASNLNELNRRLRDDTLLLSDEVNKMGGKLYGGGLILTDTSSIDPVWHRTTALSERCGRGFLNVMSQQVTIGINNEYLGLELYNFFRKINPVILAMSASSPYEYKNSSQINDTGHQSSRIAGYMNFLSCFPKDMIEAPYLISKGGYWAVVEALSSEIKEMVVSRKLDSNLEELTRVRNDHGREYSHWPFENLDPHQIFWFVRPRPDFENETSRFVIELRIPDAPIRIDNAQMINQFVVGLAYYIARNGSHSMNIPFEGSYKELLEVNMCGMNAEINGLKMHNMIGYLSECAASGIREEGQKEEESSFIRRVSDLLNGGNDSVRIRSFMNSGQAEGSAPDRLITYLAGELRS